MTIENPKKKGMIKTTAKEILREIIEDETEDPEIREKAMEILWGMGVYE